MNEGAPQPCAYAGICPAPHTAPSLPASEVPPSVVASLGLVEVHATMHTIVTTIRHVAVRMLPPLWVRRCQRMAGARSRRVSWPISRLCATRQSASLRRVPRTSSCARLCPAHRAARVQRRSGASRGSCSRATAWGRQTVSSAVNRSPSCARTRFAHPNDGHHGAAHGDEPRCGGPIDRHERDPPARVHHGGAAAIVRDLRPPRLSLVTPGEPRDAEKAARGGVRVTLR